MRLFSRPVAWLLAVLVVVVVFAVVWQMRPWDPHLGEDEVERRYSELIDVPQSDVDCSAKNGNDGSIQVDDIDYECRIPPDGRRVWLGTDSDSITDIDGEL